MAAPPLDAHARRRAKRRNTAQNLLLLAGMGGTAALGAWVLAGPGGVLWVVVLTALALAWRPSLPPGWVLQAYGARPLPVAAAPDLHRVVAVLAARAGLPRTPSLHHVPSRLLNAFAVGRREDAAIAVTDGLLRTMPGRELVAVLAHEISHIRADDLQIMALADAVGRLTQALSYVGVLLAVLVLMGAGGPDALLVAVLLSTAPTVVTLLQLALSRTREHDADLEAAALTGDPAALASALRILERHEGPIWERILVPHRRTPDPLLLRTHPPTEERVRRLLELVPQPARQLPIDGGPHAPVGFARVAGPARLHFPGVRW